MTTLPQLELTADLATGGWTIFGGSASRWEALSDVSDLTGIDGPDGVLGSVWHHFTNFPGDLANIDSLVVHIRTRVVTVDDPVHLAVRFFDSEFVALTDALTIRSVSTPDGDWVDAQIAMTGLVDTMNRARWDDARLALTQTSGTVGTVDSPKRVRLSRVFLTGTYTTAATGITHNVLIRRIRTSGTEGTPPPEPYARTVTDLLTLPSSISHGGTSAPGETRDGRFWPFATTSPWTTSLGSGAAFEAEAGPMTSMLRAAQVNDSGSLFDVSTWLNMPRFSHPIYIAKSTDPTATVTQKYPSVRRPSPITINVPYVNGVPVPPAEGTDRHLHIIQPNGLLVEMFGLQQLDAVTWHAGRLHVTDLTGSGIGPDAGVRAYGGSAIGGLIRRWEIDTTDPNYKDGVIRHPLAMALPRGFLYYESGPGTYDSNGFGLSLGYVWPATEQDSDAEFSYQGIIPMGSYVCIPQNVDLTALGLPPSVLQIGNALQDYGAYVTDRSGGTTVTFYVEYDDPGTPTDTWWREALGPSFTSTELEKLRQLLRVVTNNSPTSIGGGGTPVAPVAPPVEV